MAPAAPVPSAPVMDPTTRANRDAAWTLVDDRVVVCSGDVSVALDPVSSVVWRCLDGVSPVADVVADVAEAFGVPPSDALDAVLPVLSSWADAGLIGVGRERAGDPDRVRRALVPPPDG